MKRISVRMPQRLEGARLWDVDENEYVDYALGMGPVILGHNAKAVNEAVIKSLSQGQLYAGQHEEELELARTLCQLIPCGESVRLSMSGLQTGEDFKSYASRFLIRGGEKEVLLSVKRSDWLEAAEYDCCLHSGGRSFMLRETISDLSGRMDPGGSFPSIDLLSSISIETSRFTGDGAAQGSIR